MIQQIVGVGREIAVMNTIIEVKNVSALSMTPQIQDMMVWAVQNGKNFQLWVRDGAQVSDTITSAAKAGLIDLQYFVPQYFK